MNRPAVGLVALGAVLATVLLVTLTREQRRGAAPAVDETPVVVESAELADEAPPETSDDSDPHAADPATSQREVVPGTLADELARAHWVEGRVIFPPGTPADEEAFVIARGKEFADGEVQRARVERDGRFRLPFAEESKGASLALEARYLYLEKNVGLQGRKRADKPVVLEPLLGARITGRLVPPGGADPASIRGKVKLHRIQSWGTQLYERDIGDDLAFEFRALPPDSQYRVVYEGDALVASAAVTELEAGRTTHMEIELERGAELSGRVMDESGTGLGGIHVNASVEGARVVGMEMRFGKSAPDGAFRIAGLPAGSIRLHVKASGYANAEYGVGTLDAGEVREGLELVLRRGSTIAGRVQWPDGTPAKDITVEAVTEVPWNVDGSPPVGNGQATSAMDGTFLIAGLGDVPYRVKATAWDEKLERDAVVRTPGLTAYAEKVKAGTSDLVLILTAGHELTGRVVDDLGTPVRSYGVHAVRLDRHGAWGSRSIASEDGFFRLDGFSSGDWELTASGTGYGSSRPVRVSIPAAEPVVLTLPREARVRGIVVDPAGLAVRDARVHAAQSRDEHWFDAHDRKTNERGAFELGGLSGTVFLTASASEWAPSAALLLELTPGEMRTDVVLRLDHGGRITGEVRDRSGTGVANVPVQLASRTSHYSESL